jgi:hypothetical protein
VARKRFRSRGRVGDVFEKRFDDHIESIGPIVAAMMEDNVRVVEYSTDQECGPESIFQLLNGISGWSEGVGNEESILGTVRRPKRIG